MDLRLKSTELESQPFEITVGPYHYIHVKCLKASPETVTIEYRKKDSSEWISYTVLTKGREYNNEKLENRIHTTVQNIVWRIVVDKAGAEVYTTPVIGQGSIAEEIRKSEQT